MTKRIIKKHSRRCNPFVYKLRLNVPMELNLQGCYVGGKFQLVGMGRTIQFHYEYMTSINSLDDFVNEVMDRLRLHPSAEEIIAQSK